MVGRGIAITGVTCGAAGVALTLVAMLIALLVAR
jgi:hypothetical protein